MPGRSTSSSTTQVSKYRGALELIDDELMHRQLDTNVVGPLRTIRAVMPAWRARRHGVIVNISSVVGIATSPFGGAYAASKHALEAMSEALYWEPHNNTRDDT